MIVMTLMMILVMSVIRGYRSVITIVMTRTVNGTSCEDDDADDDDEDISKEVSFTDL